MVASEKKSEQNDAEQSDAACDACEMSIHNACLAVSGFS